MSIGLNASAADAYQKALESLQNKVPLTYNESVRRAIELYKGQKQRFSEVVGLSKYYFPIFEKVFRERGLPDELKYLSVIESSLNPQAVSKMGATGAWQFLYEIGKLYGLAINDSIDERKDPVLAANAAASYLLDSYAMYDDWLLAIASYNCGRNNIRWATEKAGGKTDYWSIRQYLPAETQHYIPAYIATVYLMNNYQKHGIVPINATIDMETEILSVKATTSFEEISKWANISINRLIDLNPSYKRYIVYGSDASPKRLVIPLLPTPQYNAVCKLLGLPLRKLPEDQILLPVQPKLYYYITYRVQEGDTFSGIAGKFEGSSAEDIKKVNRLENEGLIPGTLIHIRLEKV